MIRTSRAGILALALILTAALTVLAALAPGGLALAQDAAEVERDELLPSERNTIAIVEEFGPSVVAVNVTVEGRVTNPLENVPEEQIPPFLREFIPQFEQQQGPQMGSGSGFVVDDEGHIVTNYHVVQRALSEESTEFLDGAEITVTFPENGTHPARVLGANALYDLALLELENPDDLPADISPIPLAEGTPLVGQKTIAIGNPFGFESTVTSGIVSAVGRNLPGIGEVNIPLVQTDAAVNPGNSGGPLLSSEGRLIGVNTAIIPNIGATGQRGSLGIGFAVPSGILAGTIDDLTEGGFVSIETRPRLGLSFRDVRAYPEGVRERLDLPDQGAGVLQVEPGGAADEAGIQGSEFGIEVNGQTLAVPGDVITHVNGEEIVAAEDLQSRIFALGEGDTVTLTILRNGEEMEVEVELAVVPQDGATQDEDDAENGDDGENGENGENGGN